MGEVTIVTEPEVAAIWSLQELTPYNNDQSFSFTYFLPLLFQALPSTTRLTLPIPPSHLKLVSYSSPPNSHPPDCTAKALTHRVQKLRAVPSTSTSSNESDATTPAVTPAKAPASTTKKPGASPTKKAPADGKGKGKATTIKGKAGKRRAKEMEKQEGSGSEHEDKKMKKEKGEEEEEEDENEEVKNEV